MSFLRAHRFPTSPSWALLAPLLFAAFISPVGTTRAEAAISTLTSDRTPDGEWAVVGASEHEGYRGVAYVYRHTAGRWVVDATLAPAERGAFARFGGAVAVDGSTLVVGAPWDDGWQGAAYVYERTGDAWQLVTRIAPEGVVGDRFGTRVGVSEGVVSLASDGGAVVRFRRSPSGWSETGRTPAGGALLGSGRTVETTLLDQVGALGARDAAGAAAALAIAPPAVVRASDATYEDRTEIRWSTVDAGTFLYKIYRRLAGAPPSSNLLIRVASQDDSLYADVAGTPGVEYTYCVTVADMAGVEGASTCDDGSRIIFPPTTFAASDATFEGFVRLSWSDRSSVEAGYRILRDGNPLVETLPDISGFNDLTAIPGTTYSYELIAFDAAGNTTAPVADDGQSAFIASPRQVSASDGQFTDRVVITWQDATAREVSYRVYRANGGAPALLATLAPGSTSYEDSTAVTGTPYDYCVAAVDSSDRESARSCDAGGIGVLPAPAGVLATDGVFDDKVRITWQDVSTTEDGFLIYRMPAGTADSVLVGNVAAGFTTFDDNSGVPGTAYTYCVAAFSNQGGRSIPVCDGGLRAVVLAPVAVEATDGTLEDRVDITWQSTATAAVLFKIYRNGAFIRSVAADRRAFSDDNLASGVRTNYSVTAVSALGTESSATADSGSRLITPPLPVKASDDEFEDRVTVTWVDRSAIEDGYFVRRRIAGTSDPFARIATRPSNSATYLDRTGASGQAYEYSVTAFHAYGAGAADTTESEAGTNGGGRSLVAPTFVDATDSAFENQIVVTWVDDSRYEEAYHLWRRNTATNDSSRVAVLPPNSDRYADASVVFGTTYAYSVFAVDSLGGALLGRSLPGTDSGATSVLPPSVVSASEQYSGRVVVAWVDQSAIETAYRISRDGVVIGSAAANATTFTDLSALQGTPYTYCVRTVATTDSSEWVCDTGRRGEASDPTAARDFVDRIYAQEFLFPSSRARKFGWSLGGDGQRLIVGEPQTGGYSEDPRAHVFVRSDTGYVIESVLNGFGINQRFGGAVALHGNSALVASTGGSYSPGFRTYWMQHLGGYPCNDYNGDCSNISFFERSTTPGAESWDVVNFVLEPGATSVDMDANWALVGTVGSTSGAGAVAKVRFYPRSGSGWGPPQDVLEASPVVGRFFGASVGLSGNTTIVGATSGTGWLTSDFIPPVVYLYTLGQGQWTQTQTLVNPDGRTGFGQTVAIDGRRAVVGDFPPSSLGYHGRVFVYDRDDSGTWNHTATLVGDTTLSKLFGFSVSVRGDSILVGAPELLPAEVPSGLPTGASAVYLFTLQDGLWVRSEVRSPGTQALGFSVKVFDQVIAAGAPRTPAPNLSDGTVELLRDVRVPGPTGVLATDAEYRDKVRVRWVDLFSDETGFNIYRDGILIGTTEPNIRTYFDLEGEPGRTYEYCVAATFADGSETSPACDLGVRPADGNITGRVSTQAGAGVSGARVVLDPAPNRAVLFDGSGAAMTVPPEGLFGDAITVEFWYRGHGAGAAATLLRHTTRNTLNAFTVTNPGNLTATVNGTALATNVAVNDGEWHHVAIDREKSSGALHVYKDGQLEFTGSLAAGARVDSIGTLVFGASLAGAMDDIRIWSRVRSEAEINATRDRPLTGNEPGLAAYWPLDAYQGLGAQNLAGELYGRLVGGAQWVGEAAPLLAFAVSDDQGNYVLPNLLYGASTTFKVTPVVDGHQFLPAFKTITLSTGNPVQNEVGFSDITSYTVSGFVRYAGLACVAENVPIYVDGEARGTTDGNGRYSVPVPPGAHTIEARLPGHTFLPAAIPLANVTANLEDQSFSETTVRTLSGQASGGCNAPIGTLAIRIASEDGCFSRTFDADGFYEESLPPLKYFVSVIDVTGGFDEGRVLQFFDNVGTREVDLSSSNQTLDFKFRAPLKVEIEGLPAATCLPVGVIAQTERYPLTIRVFEDYGTSTCPVDTGTVTVFDEILDQEKNPVTLVVRNGLAYVSTPNGLKQYETAGNKPNIFAGRRDSEGIDRSYQKSLTVMAEVEGQRPVTRTIWAIVTGHRPRAATFTALSEGIPLFVLRDPPGDRSFSSLAQGTSLCTKISNTIVRKASTGFEARVILGINIDIGLFVMTRTKAQAFVNGGMELGVEWKSSDEMEVCATTTEEFKTSADNLFIGRDGDVYVGMAMNLLFAKTDVIKVEGCSVVASEEIAVGVDDIPTVYTFTDWHIRNVLIPQLNDLARANPADSLRYNSARRNWEQHLALNDSLVGTAPFAQNRSFSAGSEYTYSASFDTTKSTDWSVNVFADANYGAGFDFEVAGSGSGFSYYSKFGLAYERGGAATGSTSRTTSYTLADDDIGDFYSVDVKNDPLFGTPVFDLVGGTSSCPWEPWLDPVSGEPRTQPVDGPRISIEPPVRNNVPPDSPAVFTLNLTNDSQAGSLREYQLYVVQESNPGGAVLRLDGDAFSASGVSFFIDPGQTRQATLTVERGPSQYFYNDLKVVMVPPCEYELFRNGGPLNLTNAVLFSVGFEAPCGDITLLRPSPGWSVKAGVDSLKLILTDFELAISETDSLVSIGAEYQRSGTDVWLPVGSEITLPRLALAPDGRPASVSLMWPVASVPEGTYAIRAFTRCPNGRNFSSPATGVIDRSPPLVFGTPQPADGTLSFGEDISITFNEEIDCATASATNVRLDVIGGLPSQAVTCDVACNGRTLVITPTSPSLAVLESGLLQARVENIRDVTGNPLAAPASWQFTVRRSSFAWSNTSLVVDAAFGQESSARSSLSNGTGTDVEFSIEHPAWLTPSVDAGTVRAGEAVEIDFTVAGTLPLGSYVDTVRAVVHDGPTIVQRLALAVRVDVACVPPALSVDPADFEHTMTIVSEVKIDGVTSTDPDDILAAYVGTQLRGVAHPVSGAPGQWLYFLTVYSDRLAGETVRFQVWDSDSCRLYTATNQVAVFETDKRLGTLDVPFALATRIPAPGTQQLVPVNQGWTWISLNRRSPLGLATNLVLGDLNPSAGDLIKTLGQFSTFDPSLGWQGTLDSLDNATGYMLSLSEAGTLIVDGSAAFPSLTPIPVGTGWNWIGYVPQTALPPNAALAGFTTRANGDVIKSQFEFAQFNLATNQWIGSLTSMEPGRGYKLYTTSPGGSFIYPNPPGPALASSEPATSGVAMRGAPGAAVAARAMPGRDDADAEPGPGWQVNPRAYQYNMTITAELQLEAGSSAPDGFLVAAMVDGEVRGVAQAQYVSGLGKHMIFLMAYSNALQGETMVFQVYDPAQNTVRPASETIGFEADRIHGTLASPLQLRVGEGRQTTTGPFHLGHNIPNPFSAGTPTRITYSLPIETHVELAVFDVTGRLMRTLVSGIQSAGYHEVTMEAGSLEAGTYYYRMKAGSQVRVEKMTLLR